LSGHIDLERIELNKSRVIDSPKVTYLAYRLAREA